MGSDSIPASRAEHRWPVLIAVIVALVAYLTLPSGFSPTLRYIVAGLGVVLLIPLIAINPVRLHRETPWSRWLSLGLTLLLLLANQVALVQLIVQLVTESRSDGQNLLIAALQVWGTNVIVYALIFWEIDRGGPIARTQTPRSELPPADFRFPQDEDHDAVREVAIRSSQHLGWTPAYVDYLYFALTNSMAFSPADTMPLSHRAKLLMGAQSFAGFVILALVIARAVSLIG